MKALVCREFAPLDRLQVEDAPSPSPGPREVLIAVHAASVNFPDVLLVQGKYQAKPPLPFIPGSEAAGIVKAVGAEVTNVPIGAPVLTLPLRGAFAEEVKAPVEAVFPLDPAIALTSAAAIPMTYGTAYHALYDRARLQPGETLLVLGAGGGVGLAAVEIGKLLGAKVIAAASSSQKLDAAASRGADELINYSEQDLRARLKEIVQDAGVDVVCDPIGGPHSESALRSTTWRGRYLVVGFAAGEIPRIAWNIPLLKGSSIVGVFWGELWRREPQNAHAQIRQLIEWLRTSQIKPLISATYPLAQARDALQSLADRRVAGKVLIVPHS